MDTPCKANRGKHGCQEIVTDGGVEIPDSVATAGTRRSPKTTRSFTQLIRRKGTHARKPP